MSAMSSELLPAPGQHRGDFRERVTVLSHAVHFTPAEAGATIIFPLFTEDAEPQRGQVTIPRPHSWLVVMLPFQVRWIRGQSPSSRGRLPTPPLQGKAPRGAAPALPCSPTPLHFSRDPAAPAKWHPLLPPALPLPHQSPTSPSKLSLLCSFLES